MKRIPVLKFAVPAVVCAMFMCGCAAVKELPPELRTGEPSAPEYRIARELLICFMNDDAKGFNKRLSPENRRGFDVEKFNTTRREMTRSLGTPVSFTYLTELEFVTFKLYVWKVKFRRETRGGEGKEKKELSSEALFRVITGRSGKNEVLVMGFNFL